MSQNPKQGLIKKQTLIDAEIREIEQLAHICNSYENLHMRIGWLKLRPQQPPFPKDFLYYEDGALVGYLGLDGYGTTEEELTGMVNPGYRHRGIFTSLLRAAKEESRERGIERLILVCEHSSPSGLAFVQAIGAQHDFSEHKMVLETFREKMSFDDRLIFGEAHESDFEALVTIAVDESGSTVEEAQKRVRDYFQEADCRLYLATFGEASLGCKEPVGYLRLYDMGNEIGIYGFIVRPEYRGRGYGRQMLEETIRLIQTHSRKQIMLEVETANTNALGLYRSCGFEEVTTYRYYKLDLTLY